MIGHTQRHFASIRRRDGHSIDGTPGDCLRAAVATLFDEPDDLALPHFAQAARWFDALRIWSIERYDLDWSYAFWTDYELGVVGPAQPGHVISAWWAEEYAPNGRCLVTGHSPRGDFMHVVVGDLTGRVLWDPHPSRAGLRDVIRMTVPIPAALTLGHHPMRLALEAAS